jgi:hypothetical protein
VRSEELLTLLGKATANGQALELTVALVLGRLLNLPDEPALRIGRRLSIPASLETITELAALASSPLGLDGVKAWVQLARVASDARNRVIHSPWLGDPATGELRGVITRQSGTQSRSAADLQQDITSMWVAIEGGHALVGRKISD